MYVVDTSRLARLRPDLKCDPIERKCPPSLPVDYAAILAVGQGKREARRNCGGELGKIGCETKKYKKRCKKYCPAKRR